MIVVDTSVGLKWIQTTSEKYIDEARLLYKKHLKRTQEIVVPQLFFIEVANALTTKSHTKATTIHKALQFMVDSNFVLHPNKYEEIVEAALLAKRNGTSVYDMLYAVVADNLGCELVTADEMFIQKTKFRHVKHISQI